MIYPTYPKNYPGRRYTAPQFDDAAALYRGGADYAEACANSGMSEKTLYRFLRRNGLVEHRPSGWMVQVDLATMRRDSVVTFTRRGFSGREIADRLAISARSVFRLRAVARAAGMLA